MIPPALVRVFPMLLLVALLIGVARAFPLAEDCPYYILPVYELGRNVEDIDDCLR
jgi:hypothetical protein